MWVSRLREMVITYFALRKLVTIRLVVNNRFPKVIWLLTLPSIAGGHPDIANVPRLNNVMKCLHLNKILIDLCVKRRQ